ncbi:hypothetical protein NKH72_22500 [Mesorhizobium sp. M0955]|uniref:hypothetical protein n=1 Tax=Mesorhizobium sp. M0955 TaxID=2957033 RepID=UPI003338A772
MSKTIHFNTGRLYSAAGQRITATLHEDGHVTFFDHDRMVDGEITFEDLRDFVFDQESVMRAYDNHRAHNTIRSWSDGMQRGGCNAKWEG